MPRIKRSEVTEIRIVDRKLPDGRFESTAYIRARGHWYRDTRYPETHDGRYDRKAIIDEFIAFQDTYAPCDEPRGFAG
jgi:hypothetical protein